MTTNPENDHKKYFYFVDNERYETDEAHATGATIKSRLPEAKRTHQLFLAGHGDPQPVLINDDTRVSFDEGPKYFSTKIEKEHYFYFVDGVRFESEEECATGAIIKSRLPDAKRAYALYLEGKGNEPDKLIKDDESIALGKHEQHRLYTVPPASFGIE